MADISVIEREPDVDTVLRTVSDQLRGDRFAHDSIVLDISHSFRSLPIVFLLSLMQLEALDPALTLEKIYYSRHAGSQAHDRAPVVDLTYLRTMLEWYDAFKSVRRTGSFRGIKLLLDERRADLFRDGTAAQSMRDEFATFVGRFGAAQEEIDAGFPLEVGIQANRALEALSDLEPERFVGPEGMVLEPLERLLDGFDTQQDIARKTEYQLTLDELRREATLVEYYLSHEKYWIALECGRELFINRLLYDAGHTTDWLDTDRRQRITPRPGYIEGATHDNPAVQRLWDRISETRNKFAHAGFKADGRPSDTKIERWLTTLCRRIDDDAFWNDGGGHDVSTPDDDSLH